MNSKEAQSYITSNNLAAKLEPILSKHRYAEIVMDVTYEIAGKKEQEFVISKFNKSIQKEDYLLAFSIQRYMIRKYLAKEYTGKFIRQMNIPKQKECAAMLNNKIWLECRMKKKQPDEEQCGLIKQIYGWEKKNTVFFYNSLICDMTNTEFTSMEQINNMQTTIDELYNNPKLTKDMVKALDLELQFRALNALDSIDPTGTASAKCYDRIKTIIDINDANWKSAYKLANLFLKHGDYNYSGKLMETYLNEPNLSEDYLFTYISLCGHTQARIMSNRFAKAAQMAATKNPERFCNLFKDSEKTSFQVLDNPFVKDTYCKTCKK